MSSPAEPNGAVATASPVAFALQELIACWDQGYAALANGDLEQLAELMALADEHLAAAGDGSKDGPHEARLRNDAQSSRGRLEHGMRSGLDGLAAELTRVRQGAKVLRGYGNASVGLGANVARTV